MPDQTRPSLPPCLQCALTLVPVRLVLNYKGLPYTTHFLTHPTIAPTLSALPGLEPNRPVPGGPPAVSPYTVPAIRLPSSTEGGARYLMDSAKIVPELERLWPEPGLHLDESPVDEVIAALLGVTRQLLPIFMPLVGRSMVVESSREWFYEARKAMFGGMSLDRVEQEKGGEPAWRAAEANMGPLSEVLRKYRRDGKGRFVLGEQVSYADFVVAGVLEGLRQIDEQGMFGRVVGWDGRLREVWEGCGVWLERKD